MAYIAIYIPIMHCACNTLVIGGLGAILLFVHTRTTGGSKTCILLSYDLLIIPVLQFLILLNNYNFEKNKSRLSSINTSSLKVIYQHLQKFSLKNLTRCNTSGFFSQAIITRFCQEF